MEGKRVATHYAQSSVTISGDLIAHVRRLFSMAQEEVTRRGGGTAGAVHGAYLAPFAIPAYIVAVASVESFVNEVFLSEFASLTLSEGLLPADSAENLELGLKLILVPHLAFGRTLAKDKQPYQDMVLLIRLRNELVHYKMGAKPPKPVTVLAQRGIVARVPREQEKAGGPLPWADRVSTLEGILWAHNVACATVAALLDLMPKEKRVLWDAFQHNFLEIRRSLSRRGLNVRSQKR